MADSTMYSIILFVFLAILVLNGLRINKRVSNASDFITGGQSIGVILSVGMFVATFLSSSSVVGQVGFVHMNGWSAYSSILGTVISMLIMGYFFVGKFRRLANYGFETIPDYLASRYNSKNIRGLASLFIVLLYTIFMAVETMGLAKTLEAFLGWNYYFSVIVITAVTLVYITFGGLYAVAVNDSICALIGVGGTLLLTGIALTQVGGFTALNNGMAEINPDLVRTFTGNNGLPFIISMATVWGIGNASHPAFLAQAYGAKSEKSITKGMAYSAVFVALFYLATQILGGASSVLYPNIKDPDHAFVYLVKNMMNPFLGGILIASVLALVVSTTDTVLLTAGAAFSSDFIVKTLGRQVDEKQRLKLTRLGIIIIGVVGAGIAMTRPTQVIIFQMLNFGAAGAVFFVPIIFGFYWKKANRVGALSSMLGGLLTYIVWFLLQSPFGLHPVIIGVVASILLMILGSIATKPEPTETINLYFNKL